MNRPTPQQITDRLTEPFPVELIEQKNGLSYLPQEIIRERLIDATGNCFDWSIDQVLFRDDGVTRRGTDRNTGEARRPLSMIVIGTLTIPGLGSRAGIGAHPLDEGAGEDAAYKSAESDALKRAAMAFGVALRQLYIDKAMTARVPRGKSANTQARSSAGSQRIPEPISDDVFASEAQRAVDERDNEALRRLVGVAGKNIKRWVVLINSASSSSALSWIERQAAQRDLSHPDLDDVLATRRAELAA